MKNLTSSLYLADQTVFTTAEIGLVWQESNPENLKSKINYYCKTGLLTRVRRGIFTLFGREYRPLELANRIFVPSYISLETVLTKAGVIFQYDSRIYSVSYQTREVEVGKEKYIYRCVSPSILTNPIGIENVGNYTVASKERAFLDSLYLNGKQYFDHLDKMDWDLCRQILPIYQNLRLEKLFETYAKR